MIVIGVGNLAEKLGVHRNTIRNWIRDGRLPARQAPGKGIMLSEEDYDRVCKEYGLDPAAIRVKHLPAAALKADLETPPELDARVLGERSLRLRPNPQWADVCLTCGSCASACPISGVDGLDPRKAVRMVVLGLEQDLVDSQWPWKCTLCGKCEEACPMKVELVSMFRTARGMRERDKVPGPIHKGVVMCLNRGNNLGIPKDDFLYLLDELGEEMAEDCCPGIKIPVDKVGANLMVTINSKEPFGEPDDMKFWWKIFYAAKEDWTIPSVNWEGVNWGLFSGDDEAMKTFVGRIVENMYRLQCKTLLLPE
jgi:excisionase family DNA binding protein